LCGWPAFSRHGFGGAAYGWHCRYCRSLFVGLALVMRGGGSGARLSETKAMVKVETGRERLNVTCRIYRMELGVMRMVRKREGRCTSIPALERGVHNMRTKSHDIKLPPSTTIHQTREQELQNLSAECIWAPTLISPQAVEVIDRGYL